MFATQQTQQSNHIDRALGKFSSWTRLKKIIAWTLRYIKNIRNQIQRRGVKNETVSYQSSLSEITPLSVNEIKEAEIAIIKYVQKRGFEGELISFGNASKQEQERSSRVKKCSSIYKCNPILKDGIIRVGGRLRHAPLENEMKHPVILPKKHHIVKLIIDYYHRASGHSGVEYTLSLIRQRFWIVGARSSVRNINNKCFDCRRRQAPAMQQKMADLKEDRVTPSKPPFTDVGVDCFGPFTVRRGRTTAKRYCVLFTCLAIRAVHVEVAQSMDTESFINALRRFIARRGLPREIRSDNGGNFVKGERELREALQSWNQAQIHEFLLQCKIKWIFNPPAASHHGVWERCIRTVRKVMKALLREQILDDEGLNTLMCEVESVVNGRPITKVSDDPKDVNALTPNHLLLLRAGSAIPPGVFEKEDNCNHRRWRQVQYLTNVFWRRWVREYLPSLQQRQRWNKPQRNLAVNDVVLLLDENTPHSIWPLGRVLEVYHNRKDGLVHSANVQTKLSVPKLHKPNTPMRPIVSHGGSPTYQLSKYLTTILQPLTNESRHKVQSTKDFIDIIKTVQIPDDHKLVSFDVKSLFTSIPLQLALDCTETAITNSTHELPLPKDDIMDLLKLCLTCSFFQYNDKHYKELHGTAMGSSVSGVVEEIVMQNIEQQALATYKETLPLWLRYVDDTFTAVHKDEIDFLHKHLNKQNT